MRRDQSPDFTQHWIVLRAAFHGVGPTAALEAAGWTYHGYYYPFTAAVAVLPVVWLPLRLAQIAFVGLSLGTLAYALTDRGWWGLLWLVSGPVLQCAGDGQWSPLLTAAIALPARRGLWIVKPNVGLALAAGWGIDRRAVAGGALLLALTFVIFPGWVQDLLAALPHAEHVVATWQRPFGWLLLLALLRWRRPEARYLAVFALLPQSISLYEMVPLVLCATTRRELMLLTALTQAAFLLQRDSPPGQAAAWLAWFWAYAFALGYLPALLLVLRHPNVAPTDGKAFWGWQARRPGSHRLSDAT
jgi:hypothetical protein